MFKINAFRLLDKLCNKGSVTRLRKTFNAAQCNNLGSKQQSINKGVNVEML
jgi:hypothetical protein